ncbi:MAG: hypothetical protein ACLUKN_00620 [Bacilli bacterium]
MQQDILASLGLFPHRAFRYIQSGHTVKLESDLIVDKAWCEMVVQRLPEYIDQTEQDQEAWRISGREVEIGSQN